MVGRIGYQSNWVHVDDWSTLNVESEKKLSVPAENVVAGLDMGNGHIRVPDCALHMDHRLQASADQPRRDPPTVESTWCRCVDDYRWCSRGDARPGLVGSVYSQYLFLLPVYMSERKIQRENQTSGILLAYY